jgi:predicted RNA-binding Zn-ribbon protein involved in translation (DUF1610 family)
MARPVTFRQVERELQRARSARRYLPWVATTAVGVSALAGVAARSLRAAAGMLVPGLAFGLFVALLVVPRCPGCGGSLWRRGERPGPPSRPNPTEVERTHRCPSCGAAFD